MTTHRLLDRRMAIAEMGKAGLAVVVFGVAACSEPSVAPSSSTTGAGTATTTTPSTPTTTVAEPTTTVTVGASFHRVDLGFVSAYLLYRGGEAALVDTGVSGSEGDIEAALAEISLGWAAVGTVIATHKHPDHIGSLEAVLAQAPDAQVYAGAADIPAMEAIATPIATGDGERVFDLDVVETPGHTAGHISVFDPIAGIMVMGDAVVGVPGGVEGPDPAFAEDMTVAVESVAKLAGFRYQVALFGHGPPLLEGASEAVNDLASRLG